MNKFLNRSKKRKLKLIRARKGASITQKLTSALGRVHPLALILTVAIFLFSSFMPAIAQTARHYTELQFASLPEIQIPPYTRYQLNNGMVVYLMEDRELPLVGGTALFRTGGRLEPAEKVGLTQLAGQVMRTGGTQRHSGDEINQLLEQRAASIETGVSTTAGSASFNALSEDLPTVFNLFAEVIQQPVFAQDKLDLAKTQTRGGIARRNDEPDSIAQREFQKLIYGGDSPYARTVEYATLDNVSRQDLQAFHQQYLRPQNTILGIVGDFDSKVMRQLIQQQFGNWNPPGQPQTATVPSAAQANQSGVFLVDRPQLTQSNILMGHLGGLLNSPDYPALDVMNGVLNGMGGRLFNQVRSRQGLAYSVYGVWNPAFDYPGVFIAGGQTRSEATVPFIQSIFSEMERIRTQPITPAELAYAKESVLNSFVFNFQNPSQTLSRLMRYEYYNYPNDFIFRYQKGVEATTIQDVQRVANRYLQPDKVVTLVVGNSAEIQPPLTTLTQEVTPIDITIPGANAQS